MGDVIDINDRIAQRDRRRDDSDGAPDGAAVIPVSKLQRQADLRARVDSGADRASPQPRTTRTAAFFFELGCPLSYVAAERVERTLGEVTWVPSAVLDRSRDTDPQMREELLSVAAQQARIHRLPLIEPERFGSPLRLATRAAAYAAGQGAGPRFALAAFRLSFCGGFDLEDPATIGEAAAAAGLNVVDALTAASDARWDIQPTGTARGLLGHGITQIPAIRVGSRWFQGPEVVSDAAQFTTFRVVHDAAGI